MSITTMRPTSDDNKAGISFSSGTVMWSLLDDTAADDATYIFVAASVQYPNAWALLGLPTVTLTAAQRIRAVRMRLRGRVHAVNNSSVAHITNNFRSPTNGARTSPQNFSTSSQSFVDWTGAWYKSPPSGLGTEWTVATLGNVQADLRWAYSWSGKVNIRLSELYVDVDIRDQPSVSGVTITGATSSTSPTVSWTYTPNADGDPQIAYRVKMFSAAQYGAAGFNAETSTATWDSGVLSGNAAEAKVGMSLPNGVTFKAYVKAAQDLNGAQWYSVWASSSATGVALTPLPLPTLTVTPDATVPWLRNKITVQQNLNRLTEDDSTLALTTGSWVALANVTVIRSLTQALHGTASMRMTATSGADMTARTASGTSGYRVKAGQAYTFLASFRSAVTGRSVNVGVAWYDRAGAQVGSNTYGSNITDNTSGWVQATLVSSVAPTNAVYAAVLVKVQAAGASEQHYVDQISMTPGSSTVWSPGGFFATSGLQTAATLVEWAWPTTGSRNLAPLQLWSGGDVDRNTDGFYTTGTNSTVTYDKAEQHHGEGSIRWGVHETTSKLYMGWWSTAMVDAENPAAIAAVPGRQYTFGVWAKASQTFSSQLNLQAIDKDGNTVGSATNGGGISITTGWQLFTATITVPASAVFVRAHLDNTASVTERSVWVDECQWVLGSTADTLTRRGSGFPLVWQPVRGAGVGELVASTDPGDQLAYVYDNEVPPGFTVMYRARNHAAATEDESLPALSSGLTPVAPTMMTSPGAGVWVLRDPRSPVNTIQVHTIGLSMSIEEQAGVFYPLRPATQQLGQRPVVISDFIGGKDGEMEMWCDSEREWSILEQLLHSPRTLWLIFPEHGARYLYLRSRPWTHESPRTGSGEDSVWRRKIRVSYLEVDRPPAV